MRLLFFFFPAVRGGGSCAQSSSSFAGVHQRGNFDPPVLLHSLWPQTGELLGPAGNRFQITEKTPAVDWRAPDLVGEQPMRETWL